MEILRTIEVKTERIRDTIRYEDTPILQYQLEYPVISSPQNLKTAEKINEFYRRKVKKLMEMIEKTLQKEAIRDYQTSIKNKLPIHRYEVNLSYTITYNRSCTLSLYMQEYCYSGGAHGATQQSSQTWSIDTGRQLAIRELLANGRGDIAKLLEEVTRQITQDEDRQTKYFADNEKQVRKQFEPKQFYITKDGIVIYYQQYDIAPYATGIPTFLIPREVLAGKVPACKG